MASKDITNSVQPDHGFFGSNWPDDFAIPRSLSTGGWTTQSPGYEQQTFLGASITSFSMNGAYGDSSSTLSVELVVDEFNKSDGTGLGEGDDVYHDGTRDQFRPPFVGSPVFFKFGRHRSSVKDSFYNTIDEFTSGTPTSCNTANLYGAAEAAGSESLYELTSLSSNSLYDTEKRAVVSIEEAGKSCGLTFGGILQSYTQNRSTNGNPLYSIQVTDPREILANVKLILNNYTGSVHDNDNLFNIYGFLEYNPPSSFNTDTFLRNEITRGVNNDGTVEFTGDDTFLTFNIPSEDGGIPEKFPITGKGFARRSAQGIPFYRVNQALGAMMGYGGELPQEYKDAKFANSINFRGFKYVVDLTGLPALPDFYYLDFDEMSLLELALEVCDVMNRDLFVSLVPVVDHPYSKFLYNQNLEHMSDSASSKEFIAGVIRLDAIDRSKQQDIGSIKSYLDDLEKQNIYVENRDIGFEVSNIVTDKFIAGAQETDMYLFSTIEDRKRGDLGKQYELKNMLSQQVIPYYGDFGNNVITVPKGYGSYQQILLDTRQLNINGVGAYYVATEMEIRCAMISYKKWKDFIMMYNDVYMESTEENDIVEGQVLKTSDDGLPIGIARLPDISNNYEVTVPRSLWPCMSFPDGVDNQFTEEGLPKSPCNPPYGYPLYFKRATALGIPEAGLTKVSVTWNSQIMPALAELKNLDPNSKNFKTTINSVLDRLDELFQIEDPETDDVPPLLKEIREYFVTALEDGTEIDIKLLDTHVTNIQRSMTTLPRLAKKGTENAQKIHSFIKSIGTECLGKKFLVKLPKKVNFNYNKETEIKFDNLVEGDPNPSILKGPYSFKPLPKGSGMSDVSEEYDDNFKINVKLASVSQLNFAAVNEYITPSAVLEAPYDDYRGAFEANYNPFSNLIETNYIPEPQGGFFKRDIYKDLLDENTGVDLSLIADKLPQGVKDKLIPNSLSKFTTDNGRISAYVRFDHSQYLSFDGVSQSDFVQATFDQAGNLIPDMDYSLDNLNDNNTDFHRFYNKNDDEVANALEDQPLEPSVGFLKCSIDSKVYFSPRITERKVKVYGRAVKNEPLIELPKQFRDPDTDEIKYTHGYQISVYKPVTKDGDGEVGAVEDGKKSVKIDDFFRMDEKDTDGNKVFTGVVDNTLKNSFNGEAYALITLPGRISPTKDARFRDGPFQILQPETIKHFLTMDVIKGVAGLDLPALKGEPTDLLNLKNKEENCTSSKYQNAKQTYKVALEKLQYAFPQALDLAMPSPVTPDLVVLPLTSTERFYGPWISSTTDNRNDDEKKEGVSALPRYKDLGGAVEFLKDENLAPWNYFGYTKMNEAGKLRSTFANSLLLLSERGGFVVPDAPSGLTLGKQLKDAGPLVTNISVDISTQGIRTTTQLDLYTVSFGKLQKQKENEIARSSRERKKLSDERNALIRKGLGKQQSNQEPFTRQFKEMEDKMKQFEFVIDKGTNAKLIPATNMVATVKSETLDRFEPDEDGSVKKVVKANRTGVDTAMQTNDALADAGEKFPTSLSASKSYYNTAGGDIGKMYTPASMEPFHQNMPSKYDAYVDTRDKLYFESNGDFDSDDKLDITVYED
jgi:hypothetical protein